MRASWARQGVLIARKRGWQQCRPAHRTTRNASHGSSAGQLIAQPGTQPRNAAWLRSGLCDELACTAASREHVRSALAGKPGHHSAATPDALTYRRSGPRPGRRSVRYPAPCESWLRSGLCNELACTAASREHVRSALAGKPGHHSAATPDALTYRRSGPRPGRRSVRYPAPCES